jgi:hypothetical protein
VAAVHRHQVDVDVDQQVRLGGPAVDLDVLAVLGDPDVQQVVVVLGVVVGELALREERPEHPLTDDVAQLLRGHPAVQRVRRDQLDVVDAGVGGHLQHLLDDALTHVGLAHRRQRERDVVEGDGQPHPGAQQLGQRLAALRVQQRVADRALDVGQPGQRLRRVDDAGAGREALQPEALALVHHERWGAVVDLEHEAWTGHALLLSSISKATLTVPRRPADWAWSTASRQRYSG